MEFINSVKIAQKAAIIILVIFYFIPSCIAQPRQPQIKIHRMVARQLPLPGEKVDFYFHTPGVHDLQKSVRVYASIDEKIIELPVVRRYLNKFDIPEYQAIAPAPLSTISFTAVVPVEGGLPITKTIELKRDCIEKIMLQDAEENWQKKDTREHIESAARHAQELDDLIRMQKRSIDLINQIKKELEKKQG